MSKEDQTILIEILEGVYLDTVAPLAALLQDARVDLLNLELDPDVASYWEPYSAYSSLSSQR